MGPEGKGKGSDSHNRTHGAKVTRYTCKPLTSSLVCIFYDLFDEKKKGKITRYLGVASSHVSQNPSESRTGQTVTYLITTS